MDHDPSHCGTSWMNLPHDILPVPYSTLAVQGTGLRGGGPKSSSAARRCHAPAALTTPECSTTRTEDSGACTQSLGALWLLRQREQQAARERARPDPHARRTP